MKTIAKIVLVLLALTATTSWTLAASDAHGDVSHTTEAAHGEATDAHGGEGHGESPGLLDPELGSSFFAIVLFVILIAVLGKFVWPPILKGLQDRENKITNDLQEAQSAAEKATATLKEYEAKLAAAQAEAKAVLDQARTDAQRTAEELKEQTRSEITQMKDRAESDIAAAKEQSLNEIYAQTASLSTEIAGRILRREINEADQRNLIEQSLAELTESSN